MVKCKFTYLLVPLLLFLLVQTAGAQQLNADYRLGNKMMEQQKYEQAYNIFSDLLKQHPSIYALYDKAIECLINLKKYDQAIALSQKQLKQGHSRLQTSIRLGEIYHIQGDTTKAFQVWDQVLDDNPDNMQVYLELARTLKERRAYGRAIQVYRKIRQKFSNPDLFINELAGTYLQAGDYKKAIGEYLDLISKNPDRVSYVQRSLMRFRDDFLYDTAILEIDDYLKNLSIDDDGYKSIHQLQIWLLLEKKLYKRATAEARKYEVQSPQPTYALYNLGSKLLSEQKFKLAKEAYTFYIDRRSDALKYRSMEKLADVYMQWADYLSDYNLAYAQRRDSLYHQAFLNLENLTRENPTYDHLNRVLMQQAELALDHLHDASLAQSYLDKVQNSSNAANEAQKLYVEGRIQLFNKQYDRARITFTQSNKKAKIGTLAEKTRYYLSLSDFYSGDYEFAKIQLKALEKQNTSYFANDAVKLRVWIQDGVNPDSTTDQLDLFAKGVLQINHGQMDSAITTLLPIIKPQSYHPLKDDALLELSSHARPEDLSFIYAAVSSYLLSGSNSPLRERLLWEKARMADQVVLHHVKINQDETSASDSKIFSNSSGNSAQLPNTIDGVRKLYENLLVEFPQGFYSQFARERIQELKNAQT